MNAELKKSLNNLKNQLPFIAVMILFGISLVRDVSKTIEESGLGSQIYIYVLCFCIVIITFGILKLQEVKYTNATPMLVWIVFLQFGFILYGSYRGFWSYEIGRAFAKYGFYYVILAWVLFLIYDRGTLRAKKQELENKNLQSEIALLKTQINPHFLFNTLNNIDSLIKSDSEKASASLIELSSLMRYMTYDSNAKQVPLQQELDYIEDYINLQKLQFANKNLVKYVVKGDTNVVQMAPMLFIPFVENAFKHCTDKSTDNGISFEIEVSWNKIHFSAINIANKQHTIAKDKSSGVGLEIVKRRLELLYGEKHKLEIDTGENQYSVNLTLIR